MNKRLSYSIITAATQRIRPYIHHTPLLSSQSINSMTGCELYFKCENFQKAGSFKIRGALNAVLQLEQKEKKKGVCTHSSGNFAQALAMASRSAGIKSYIVMPRTAPLVKKNAVEGYGARVFYCEPTLEAREKTLEEVKKAFGAAFIPPYNDYRVMAGHSSIVFEIIDQLSALGSKKNKQDKAPGFIITPVGGGGLLSGVAVAAHFLSPETKIIGAEPAQAADAYKSFASGAIHPSVNPDTIADGLLTSLGDKTFPVIIRHVDEIITVSENEIIQAMRTIWERLKIIVEPSSAVTLAAVVKEKKKFRGKKVVLVLSGGNVDLGRLPFK